MSDQVSDRLLQALRDDAGTRSRPGERNATIDRLVEACDAIVSGKARSLIKAGLPKAEMHYMRTVVAIKPPRVHEYVRARYQLDIQARRIPSSWTGPTATTLRKDSKLLEYVRVREQEQVALAPGNTPRSAAQAIDQIGDLGLRTEIRLLFARAMQAEQDLLRLKEGMRRMRPTVDLDSLMSGAVPSFDPAISLISLPAEGSKVLRKEDISNALAALAKLTTSSVLTRCGLELNDEHGNLIERTTRFELLSRDELNGLRLLVALKS